MDGVQVGSQIFAPSTGENPFTYAIRDLYVYGSNAYVFSGTNTPTLWVYSITSGTTVLNAIPISGWSSSNVPNRGGVTILAGAYLFATDEDTGGTGQAK